MKNVYACLLYYPADSVIKYIYTRSNTLRKRQIYTTICSISATLGITGVQQSGAITAMDIQVWNLQNEM